MLLRGEYLNNVNVLHSKWFRAPGLPKSVSHEVGYRNVGYGSDTAKWFFQSKAPKHVSLFTGERQISIKNPVFL